MSSSWTWFRKRIINPSDPPTRSRTSISAFFDAATPPRAPSRIGVAVNFLGVRAVDGTQPECNVGENLDEHATQPDHDGRSELWVVEATDNHLMSGGRHFLDQETVERDPLCANRILHGCCGGARVVR
jgi:hypothetical protein